MPFRRHVTVVSLFVAVAIIALLVRSRSAGQPAATQPALTITPDARQVLDQMRDAYSGVKSLAMAGTIDGKFDIDGVQRQDSGKFKSLYSSSGQFKSEMTETSAGDHAATQPSDTVMGNTGEKLYVFLPQRNRYVMDEAPKGKVDLDALGEDIADIVRNQNLSLALALSGDAATELCNEATSVLRVEDQKIDGESLATLTILYPRFDMTLSIDPQTHLVRRITDDLSKNARLDGATNVKSAMLTINYNNTPGAVADASAFAWSPPAGAQPLATDAGGSDLAGKPAPDFTLSGLDGQQVSLKAMHGSVVVLDFWATWCGPCVASLPDLDALYKTDKGKGAKFFAINMQEDKATIEKFVNDSKLSIPVIMDTDGKTLSLYEPGPEPGIPFTVVIGKDGVVVMAQAGTTGNDDAIGAAIQKALKK